jgi:hypothetical protein
VHWPQDAESATKPRCKSFLYFEVVTIRPTIVLRLCMLTLCMRLQKTASAARYGLHEVLAGHVFGLLDKAIDERMGDIEVEKQVCPIVMDE